MVGTVLGAGSAETTENDNVNKLCKIKLDRRKLGSEGEK